MQVSTRRERSAAVEPEGLARQLAGFLRYVSTSCDGDFLEQVSEHDLTLGQLKVLSLLAEQPAELSVKELAQQLDISLPAASRAVDLLVGRRLVAREEDADDRRVKRVQLTSRGHKLVDRLVASRVSSLEQLLSRFSDSEQQKLSAALDAILTDPEISRFCPREIN